MKRYLYTATIISTTLSTAILFLIMFWSFYPYKTIDIENNQNLKVNKAEYKPGERINYTAKYCKYTDVQPIIRRTLVNGTRVNFTEYTANLKKGCGITAVGDLEIPIYTENGLYHIEATAEYKVNPIRTIYKTWRSEEFTINK